MKKFIALTFALIMSISCFSLISFAEETKTTEHLTEVPEGYVGIYTKDELYAVRENPSGKYILMNDIIFEDEDYVKGGDFYNSGTGWEPIGTSSTPFKGTFDGNGYTIDNLYINAPEDSYQGLFGYTRYSTIQNINLINVDIVGNDYVGGIVGCATFITITNCNCIGDIIGNNYVGGIVGYITSTTITNCNFSGTSTGKDYIGGVTGFSNAVSTISYCYTQGAVFGEQFVGGIAGYQYSDYGRATESYKNVYNYNYITYCNNASLIKGNSNIGGITGCSKSYYKYYNYTGYGYYDVAFYGYSYIESCSNSGCVLASNSNAGGIVGCSSDYGEKNNNYVSNCYNLANISAVSYVGGLIGNSEFIKVTFSYSVGTITAESNFGGCFGSTPVEVTFCYYLDDAVTNPTCTSGTMKSVDQLKRKGNYEQWDFINTWTMGGREDYPYPELIDVPLVLPSDSEHKHEYTSEITTPATHIATGVMTYTCECGDTYTEDIEKLADHSYISVVTAPTCISKGYTTYTCECGDSYVADYVDATGHDFKSVVTEPTCTEHGYTTYACECGETYTRDYTDATDHSYTAVVSVSTCTLHGYTTYTCECGDSYISDYVNAKEHKDANGDYKCDYGCGYEFSKPVDPIPDIPSDTTDDCSCDCHKGGIAGFFFKIINFFQKLFGMNKVCACGVKH